MVYIVYKVSAKYIIKALEFYGKCKEREVEFNINHFSEALSTSKVNAQNAIGAGRQLGLFEISENIFNATIEEQIILFRNALQSYPPFFDFVEFLYKEKDATEAVKLVKYIHNIERNEKDILWSLKNWGVFSKIFKNKKGNIEFREKIRKPIPNKIEELSKMLDNELKIKIWIKNIIENGFSLLSNIDFQNLIDSMINFETKPRESIKKSGEVLEDFLRKIAKNRKIDVKNKNGISQIAEELRKHKIIANKHIGILKGMQVFLDRDIFDGLSAFRNIGTHGIDKEEGKRWELSSELSLVYIIQVILCIKSLHYYCIENQLKF